MAESEEFEAKSKYHGTEKERLRIIKTIICMANTRGGTIKIAQVTGGKRNLDSAALVSSTNRYVHPPIAHIESDADDGGVVTIRVQKSDRKPHIMKSDGIYNENDSKKISFHRGQVWVRHGSSNELANPDDIRSLIYEAAGMLMEVLGAKLRTPGFSIDPSNPAAVPARLVDSPAALLIQTDYVSSYPHTRQSLAEEFQKPYSWISQAMPKLGLEESARYAYTDRNSAGHPTRWRYTDAAYDVLAKKLEQSPDWDPKSGDEEETPS